MPYLLGLDLGSSSVKASIINSSTGIPIAEDFYPKTEAPIITKHPGWAEQDPNLWYSYAKTAIHNCLKTSNIPSHEIKAIGISYQMHGLVLVDRNLQPLRPAIIWCDSRAVPYGNKAFHDLGETFCLTHFLNSPGNFTASKLAWVKENEPDVFSRIYKIMLPGDYLAMRLTNSCRDALPCVSPHITTTASGLSEAILWDFRETRISRELLNYFGFSSEIIPEIVPTFSIQGHLSSQSAADLGLSAGTPISYRAGDQPNNALSLNVLNPGEIAATGGTSGVVYGVLDHVNYDPKSRVNTFLHVNHLVQTEHAPSLSKTVQTEHAPSLTRLGVLLCINGTGIMNAWIKRMVAPDNMSYAEMNTLAESAPIGSEGLTIIPFGNGAERILENENPGASIHGINFNIHTKAYLIRAAQEGIAFSFAYGMEIMREMGMTITRIKAGNANLFLSPLFRRTLSAVTGATIELYDTNGAIGAALGAGIGAGIYSSTTEAFASLKMKSAENPVPDAQPYLEAYNLWKSRLKRS